MDWFVPFLAGTLSAVIGGLGMGGGGVLLLYLTLFADAPQLRAQGMNLLFFLPVALISLLIHAKHHLVRWRVALGAAIFGPLGALCGFWLAGFMGESLLSKLFAGGLLLLSLREIFHKKKPASTGDADSEKG